MDTPVQGIGQTSNVLLIGNAINNWLASSPYVFSQDKSNYSIANNLNNRLELGNGGSAALQLLGTVQATGTLNAAAAVLSNGLTSLGATGVNGGVFNVPQLPTSPNGLGSGQLWRDTTASNVLKVVP